MQCLEKLNRLFRAPSSMATPQSSYSTTMTAIAKLVDTVCNDVLFRGIPCAGELADLSRRCGRTHTLIFASMVCCGAIALFVALVTAVPPAVPGLLFTASLIFLEEIYRHNFIAYQGRIHRIGIGNW